MAIRTYLLVCLHGLLAVALFFIYDRQVEMRSRVGLFVDRQLQVVDRLVVVLLLLVVQHTQVEVRLKVLRVD